MEWSGQGSEGAIIGYNSRADYFFNHPANGNPNISEIVSCTQQSTPAGARSKRQSVGPGIGPLPFDPLLQQIREHCAQIAQVDRESIPDVNKLTDIQGRAIFEVLPLCPPTRTLIDLNTAFESLTDQERICYRSTITFVPFSPVFIKQYEFISVCCYDLNG